jgi:hypothetical protein
MNLDEGNTSQAKAQKQAQSNFTNQINMHMCVNLGLKTKT